MIETGKAILIARKIFNIVEKGGWKRVSGAMCVSVIAIFVGIGSADIVHVWINGVSIDMEQLHVSYLWQLTAMFLLVYGAKHAFPHSIRLIALKMFKNDAEAIQILFTTKVEGEVGESG